MGITGGSYSLTWSGITMVIIDSRDALGKVQSTAGTLIAFDNQNGGMLHFYEPDRDEMWYYTLFVKSKRLMISGHQAWPSSLGGGTVGKIMQSECTVETR